MESIKRYLAGAHTTRQIRWHLAALAAGYWGLVLCARLGYPPENKFSMMTEMLSALGSFDKRYNPQWFWLFSIAMIYCSFMMIPVMLYIDRRVSAASKWGAHIGAAFFLFASVGIGFTGAFPYADVKAIGNWEWSDLHMKAAGCIAAGFLLGIPWHALLLIKDKFSRRELAGSGRFPYLKYVGPYLVCAPVFGVIGCRIDWHALFAALQAVFSASGKGAAKSFGIAFHRLFNAAYIEHMAIWAATIFVIWFALVLPNELKRTERGR